MIHRVSWRKVLSLILGFSVFQCSFLHKVTWVFWVNFLLHSILLLHTSWSETVVSLGMTASSTPISTVLVNFSWYLCGRCTQDSCRVVSCVKALGSSASDLLVTAVFLQRGFVQVEMYWPAIWGLFLDLQALPMQPWAKHFSAFPPSFICLVYVVSQEALKNRDSILLHVCTVPNRTGPPASWSPKDAVVIQVINVKEV